MQGWIKLHRKTLDNPIICKDADYFAVWCYLLLSATHKEIEKIFAGKKIKLKTGQLITDRKTISKKLKIGEHKIQNILFGYEMEHQIIQQKSNRNRLISILQWELYQETEQQITQQWNNSGTTAEQQTVNKNEKKLKNKDELKEKTKNKANKETNKEDNKENKETEFNNTIKAFKEMRVKIKSPMTVKAEQLLLKKLSKMAPDEETQIAILEESIINGWKGVFPLKDDKFKKDFSNPDRYSNEKDGVL